MLMRKTNKKFTIVPVIVAMLLLLVPLDIVNGKRSGSGKGDDGRDRFGGRGAKSSMKSRSGGGTVRSRSRKGQETVAKRGSKHSVIQSRRRTNRSKSGTMRRQGVGGAVVTSKARSRTVRPEKRSSGISWSANISLGSRDRHRSRTSVDRNRHSRRDSKIHIRFGNRRLSHRRRRGSSIRYRNGSRFYVWYGPGYSGYEPFGYFGYRRHHRRYVFVSLNGYWPGYNYRRYYWYGYHPYQWYEQGYYPYELEEDVYGSGSSQQQSEAYFDDFSDVRERLRRQAAEEPDVETLADRRFQEGVEYFENGNYSGAAGKFAEAMNAAPADRILGFAYVQALFADSQYGRSAEALRNALSGPVDGSGKPVIFYPRGLYGDEQVLAKQIDRLVKTARSNPDYADLQLLAGYQLFGAGRGSEAAGYLEIAAKDATNAVPGGMLLGLIKEAQTQNKDGN